MSRVIQTLLLFLLSLSVSFAQEITVKSFTLDRSDLTASVNRRMDGNADPCALIKVQLARSGATFQGDVVGQTIYSQSKYNVYMTKGAKCLDVNLDGYLPLTVRFEDYGVKALNALMTYKLTLVLKAEGFYEEYVSDKEQKLIVDYSPVEAVFRLSGKSMRASGGHIEETIKVGEYRYQLVLDGYVTDEGSIVVKENAPKRLHLELYPEKEATNNNFDKEDYEELIEKAEMAEIQENYTLALSLYGQVFEMNLPNMYSIANKIGEIYFDYHEFEDHYAEAVKWYRKSAEGGCAEGQISLGTMYHLGYGVEQNLIEAEKWYRKSAEAGCADGQLSLAFLYYEGDGVEQNYVEAEKWFRKSVECGEDLGIVYLGHMYYYGDGVKQDYAEAEKWYRISAANGDSYAQFNLGQMYHFGEGVEQDFAEAEKWYRMSAERDNAQAQLYLGNMYDKGTGVDQNYTEAVKWYRKSAERDNAQAQMYLGYMLQFGLGADQDYAEAVKWYSKSAESGNAQAQMYLGNMFERGYGVEKDYFKAKEWYEKAAEQGDEYAKKRLLELKDWENYNDLVRRANTAYEADDYVNAMRLYKQIYELDPTSEVANRIGKMYRDGKGDSINYTEAVKWFRRSAEKDDTYGQVCLGYMLQLGLGVDQDYVEAVKWYQKSAEKGNSEGLRNLGGMYQFGFGVNKDIKKAKELYLKAAELGDSSAQLLLDLLK